MKTKKLNKGCGILILIFIFSGCSTTRDNFFSRTYHQTTAKYNGYFNANESVKVGVRKIKKEHQENYQKIIPLDKINRTEVVGRVFPNMERAIEKTTKVITMHSMEINKKEKNKWIDDNYFLMAQARFFKKEYQASLNTFKYIIRSYPDDNLVNKSLIWSAKCEMRLENHQSAQKTLNYLIDERKLTNQELTEVNIAMSEIKINNKNYEEAVVYLERAQKTNKNKKLKPRIYFVLAQLNERLKKGDRAIENYNQTIRSNPEYEMSFRASLNKAKSYVFSSGKPTSLLREYEKMLKDAKNKDYRDQIYYAIGEVKLNNRDTLSAVENYNKSLKSFLFNINQKQQTHFKLSEIYFNQKEYKLTYNQYDSILMLMDLEDDRYITTKKTHKDLKSIVLNQDIIYKQDSLLALALLSKEERNERIDDYIDALKQKDMAEKTQTKEEMSGNNFNMYEYNKNQANLPVGGGWYFYNPTAISFGYSEFLTRWGNRKNANNWRRKNKNQMEVDGEETRELDAGPSLKEKYSREYYLSQLPLTKAQQDSSMRKIEKAYYKLGGNFKNKFSDYKQSISTYEQMLQRFSESEYKLLVYMQLVFLYEGVNNNDAKNRTLNKIRDEFPNNEYINPSTGELLTPDYENKESDYEKIYKLYKSKKYKEAMSLIDQTLKTFPADSLNIKMIQAFCISKQQGKSDFILALEKIKNQHPNTIQGKESAEMLDVLYGSFYEKEEDLYKTKPDSDHYMIITVSDLQIDIPKLQNMVSKYNNKNYSSKKLKINNLLLNKETQIIKINSFKNSTEALNYYESTFQDGGWAELYNRAGIDKMIISRSNFSNLLKEKTIKNYKKYFNKKYFN